MKCDTILVWISNYDRMIVSHTNEYLRTAVPNTVREIEFLIILEQP